MQEQHIVEKIQKSYKYDIIFGTHTMHKFPQSLYNIILENKRITDIENIDGNIIEGLPIKRNDKIRAQVTIMNGCNNFCSYCIVPYVRGRERSRNVDDILNEVNLLAKEGYKEITLLGQNVNSYKYSFSNLLRKINNIEGIQKIRFVSPHPKDFSDDVIDTIAECEKVSKLIHLPLQSGSTNILRVMNRKYTKEQYLNLVQKMKEKIKNVKFSTDIIVGFPGETQEDFEDTLDVVKQVGFEQIYMFIYSRRVGTPADKMENQVPEDIKHERFDVLKKLYEDTIKINNCKYIDTTQKIIVEGYSKNDENMLTGRTDSNKVVVFKGSTSLIGQMIEVKIISEHMWYLKGTVL